MGCPQLKHVLVEISKVSFMTFFIMENIIVLFFITYFTLYCCAAIRYEIVWQVERRIRIYSNSLLDWSRCDITKVMTRPKEWSNETFCVAFWKYFLLRFSYFSSIWSFLRHYKLEIQQWVQHQISIHLCIQRLWLNYNSSAGIS